MASKSSSTPQRSTRSTTPSATTHAEVAEVFSQAAAAVDRLKSQTRNLLAPSTKTRRMREHLDGDLAELVEQLDWYADAILEQAEAEKASAKKAQPAAAASKTTRQPAKKAGAPAAGETKPKASSRGGARVVKPNTATAPAAPAKDAEASAQTPSPAAA